MRRLKIKLAVISSLILGVFFFNSCETNDNTEIDGQSIENPFEKVGIEHNNLVKEILSSLEGKNREEKINFTNKYLSDKIETDKKSRSIYSVINYNSEIQDYEVYNDPKKLYQSFLSVGSKNKSFNSKSFFIASKENIQYEVNEVLDLLESNDLTLDEIINEVDRREKLVSDKFDEEDFETIYSFYSTMRHSFTYWAPTDQGGEGGFDNFVSNYSNKSQTSAKVKKINWWKVGGCDVVGALVGCRGGFWGAVIVGAGASVISIIMQA